jgi:ribonuclease HII
MKRLPPQFDLPGFDAPSGPTLELELSLKCVVAGVDEAGRGAWAGPVVAAAVILDPARVPPGLNDSKQLSRKVREDLYDQIMTTAKVGIGQASPAEIDAHNILAATFLAMGRAVAALASPPAHLLVDGNQRPNIPLPMTCVVKGDSRSLSIAAASIIAKVFRDRHMAELHQTAPDYGWAQNAGYGTADHQRALRLVGVTPNHRKSFAPIRHLLSEESVATS